MRDTRTCEPAPVDAPAATLEFRVLDGPQQGCRVALQRGVYYAGSGADNDLLLDAGHPVAFVLYWGHSNLALEAIAPGLCCAGRQVEGMQTLQAGDSWTLDGVHYAVETADAPWRLPSMEAATPQHLPQNPQEDAQDQAHAAAADSPPMPAPQAAALPPGDDDEDDLLPLPAALALGDAPYAQAVAAPPVPRRRTGWWVAGALLLGGSCAALLWTQRSQSAAPSQLVRRMPATAPAAEPLAALLAASADHARLNLSAAGPRQRLSGYVQTDRQRIELIRAARQLTPNLRIDISSDEELVLQARDTLARFPHSGLSIASLRYGELTLAGSASSPAAAQQVIHALQADIPALTQVHWTAPEGAASDAPLVPALRALLPRNDVVLSVGGAAPYVLLSNGSKNAGNGAVGP